MKIENQSDKESPSDVSNNKDVSLQLPSSSSNGNFQQVEEKRRRAWEQWSADDIAAFFEGLNEFGKDFDAIQNSLITRSKKKNQLNVTNIKNKDQVRHFYYRTWHKISKYLLPTPDEGKRMHKELYGLINYGEMWKKLGGFFNDRCGEKLNELVQQGVTSVKVKGKSHRIKTPVCPALKRLQSNNSESQKLPVLPERIVLELTPCCNVDFLRVQSVAHNPRIRISADSSSPFSNIISFLTKKWKPRSVLKAESVAEEELIMRISADLKHMNHAPKKGRKRTLSGQEQIEETAEIRVENKSWILETAEQVTIGELYTSCSGSDGRLQLNYSWERRKPGGHTSDQICTHVQDPATLLKALVNIAKTSLTQNQSSFDNGPPKKAARKQMIATSSSVQTGGDAQIAASKSPANEASPTLNVSTESPVQFSRMRQRLRRPLRYASSLKRNSLAPILNKMPGPSSVHVRPQSSSVILQPTTVNISWPPENDANGAGSIVLQVHLDGQTQPTLQEPKAQPQSVAPSEELSQRRTIIADVDQELFRPPSILLHTPVKGSGWSAPSTTSSLPATPNRLQEWMSLLLPSTPEKNNAESSSVRSVPFSIPDSITSFLNENGSIPTTSSCGEGSTWPTRDGDEVSLSSLLNQLVSPAKSTTSSRYTDLKLPFDLQSLVADNSVDLSAKFAELAASIAAADSNTAKHRP